MKIRMSLFFPDLNVWIALSVAHHRHTGEAWNWMKHIPRDAKLIFSRYTHIGFLRLLTNKSVMGDLTMTLDQAWEAYERWLRDPRVEFYPEPRDIETALRSITRPFARQQASKWVGDCYLLAYAMQTRATLVTFDAALHTFAGKQGHPAVIPG
jgi:toxin-antitoxin system PIN domain toxin